MFEFEDIALSEDGNVLTASCRIAADAAWFRGHFPAFPLMPGVFQILMLAMLIEQQSGWPPAIVGGSAVKFLQPVVPGETLELQLQRDDSNKVRFSVRCGGNEKSKGRLHLSGGGID